MKKLFSIAIEEFMPAFSKKPILNLDSSSSKSKWNFRDTILQNELKKEIIKYLKIKGKVDLENIIFGFGSYSILERLAWKFLDKGLMIGEFPQFRYFPMEYKKAGGRYRGLWEKDFSFPCKKIMRVIKKNKKLKIIYINNPNNPTGQVWERDKILKIIKLAQNKKVFVLIDEAYADLLPVKNSFAGLVNQYKNLMVIRSFSKIFELQNLRVGYMIACSDIINKYKLLCNWDEITNIGALQAKKVLQNTSWRNSLQKKTIYAKKITTKILTDSGFSIVPSNLRIPLIFLNKKNIANLGEYFRQRNIKVEGGLVFQVLNKKSLKNYARIRVPLSLDLISKLKEKL